MSQNIIYKLNTTTNTPTKISNNFPVKENQQFDITFFYAPYGTNAVKVKYNPQKFQSLTNVNPIPPLKMTRETDTDIINEIVHEEEQEANWSLYYLPIGYGISGILQSFRATQYGISFQQIDMEIEADEYLGEYATDSTVTATIDTELKAEYPSASANDYVNVFQTTTQEYTSWRFNPDSSGDWVDYGSIINETVIGNTVETTETFKATTLSNNDFNMGTPEAQAQVLNTIYAELEQLNTTLAAITGDLSGVMTVADYDTVVGSNQSVKYARNLLKSDLTTSKSADDIVTAVEQVENKGSANTVVPLNASSKIDRTYLPEGVKVFKGDFGAVAGDLPTSGVEIGDTYRCDSDDYTSTVSGLTYDTNDTATWNGTSWITNQSGAVDTVNSVAPDANGDVLLEADDINRAGGAKTIEQSFLDLESGKAFTDLTDTPSAYTDKGNFNVKVKSDASGIEFGRPNNNSSTSVESGCLIEAGTNPNTFKINSGTLIFVDTSGSFPVTFTVDYPGEDNITPTLQVNSYVTYVTLSYDSGTETFTVNQRFTEPTSKQRRTEVVIGEIYSFDATTISVQDVRHISTQPLNQSYDFHSRLAKKEGLVISGSSGATTFTQSAGKLVGAGINSANDIDDPNVKSVTAQSPVTYYLVYRNGTGGLTLSAGATTFDPDQYDDGSGTPQTISPSTPATNHHFYIGKNGFVYIFLGQTLYGSFQDAINGQITDTLQGYDTELLKNAVNISIVSMLRNATDFSNSAQADFYTPAVTGGGGGGSTGSVEDVNVSITATTTNISGATLDLMLEDVDTEFTPDYQTDTLDGSTGEFTNATKPTIAPLQSYVGRTLEELVSNPNFDDGTTGWGLSAASNSVTDGILSNTGNGTSRSAFAIHVTSAPVDITQNYVSKIRFRVTNSDCTELNVIFDGTTGGTNKTVIQQLTPTINQWYELDVLDTLPSDATGDFRILIQHVYADSATANGKVMEVDYVYAIPLPSDLTTAQEVVDRITTLDYGLNYIGMPKTYTASNYAQIIQDYYTAQGKVDGDTVEGNFIITTGLNKVNPRDYTVIDTNWTQVDNVKLSVGETYTSRSLGNRIKIATVTGAGAGDTLIDSSTETATFTWTQTAEDNYNIFYRNIGVDFEANEVQIEKGTSATTYTPYEAQLVHIPEMHGIGGVYDTLDTQKYVKYTIQEDDIIVLDTSPSNTDIVYFVLPSDAITPQDNVTGKLLIENKSETVVANFNNASYVGSFYASSGSGGTIRFIVANGEYASLAEAKTDLAGITVIYELDTYISRTLPISGQLITGDTYTYEQVGNVIEEFGAITAQNNAGIVQGHDKAINELVNDVQELENTTSRMPVYRVLYDTPINAQLRGDTPITYYELLDDIDNYDEFKIYLGTSSGDTDDIKLLASPISSGDGAILEWTTTKGTTSKIIKSLRIQRRSDPDVSPDEISVVEGESVSIAFATGVHTNTDDSSLYINKIIGIKY